jgi:hypothetical protein
MEVSFVRVCAHSAARRRGFQATLSQFLRKHASAVHAEGSGRFQTWTRGCRAALAIRATSYVNPALAGLSRPRVHRNADLFLFEI